MKSHPLREFSDADIWNDYEEVQNGTNPMKHEFKKSYVDALTDNLSYHYEGAAAELRDDDFVKGIMGYSAIISGVWNRQEIYRDLIIDYFCDYASADYYEDAVLEEEKKQLYDVLITCLSKGKNAYDTTYNINKLISYSNGARTIDQLKYWFDTDVAELLYKINKTSEDAIEFRASVYGNPYIKKYWKPDKLKSLTSSQRKCMDMFSEGATIAFGVVDMVDTIKSISRVKANEELFVEDMKFLNYLSFLGNDYFVRSAARDVMNCLENAYIETCILSIGADASETLGNLALVEASSEFGRVAVVIAVRDIAVLASGTDTDLEQLYSVYCYSSMTSMYVKMLSWDLQPGMNNGYYSCYKKNVGFSTRCIKNIAQLRILGENEYYEYIKSDSWLLYGVLIDFATGLSDIKNAVEKNMVAVKSVTDVMRINLSSNLMYSVE